MTAKRDARPPQRLNKKEGPLDGERELALRRLRDRTRGLRWSRNLVARLLEELGEEDELEELVGSLKILRPSQYPQAVALAIALRYSWRRDEFGRIAKRIRAMTTRKIPHG